jgi:hypothetical protein
MRQAIRGTQGKLRRGSAREIPSAGQPT